MARKLVGEDAKGPEFGVQQVAPAPARAKVEIEVPVPARPGPHPAEVDLGGDEVTIILGAEKYAPVQYHSFDVGPFIVKTTRRPGETLRQVFERVRGQLREISEVQYKESLETFLARVKAAGAAARGGR